MSDETTPTLADDLAELEKLAAKMQQPIQVYLGFRNVERAAAIRRVLAAVLADAHDFRIHPNALKNIELRDV